VEYGLAGYLFLALKIGADMPMPIIFWIWSIGFDGPHIFGTVSRTYLDREERQKRGRLLFGSMLFFFSIGPIFFLLKLRGLFLLIFGVWAYYHVVRQHYGFLVLYKKKNRDLAARDNSIDKYFITAMMVYPPFQRFFIYRSAEMGIPPQYALSQLAPWLDPVLISLLIVIGALFIGRQAQRAWAGEPLNLPKLLLLLAIVPLHWLTFHYLGPKESIPIVTIFHNIQYHGIIWYYNRNRYQDGAQAIERHGRLPIWLTRHFCYYALAGILFAISYRVPGYWLSYRYDLAMFFFTGFAFTHYYLDSRIWRVRHDNELSQTLKLA
jgi:hypothetical protein